MSIKYKSAKYVKYKRGEYQSKICPYGYEKSANGRMEPDPETAPIVRMIFEIVAQGQNTTAIIKVLFDRGVPTPGEYKKAKGQANRLGTADIGNNMGSLSAEHSEYSQQISEMQERKRVLIEQMILGELSEPEYREKRAALDNELVRLQEVQSGLSTQLSHQQADIKTKSSNRRLAQKVVDTGQLSTELVDALIERVYVYPEQKIEIVWKAAGFSAGEDKTQKTSEISCLGFDIWVSQRMEINIT